LSQRSWQGLLLRWRG